MASVESNLANECSLAIFTAVVDLPTPVAPAIRTRIGGAQLLWLLSHQRYLSASPLFAAVPAC